VFPHHENEVAQSTCAFGHNTMANVFMHNGFLQVEGRKMSKSEGNFVTINELLATDRFGGRAWSGQVLRLAMLRTHYRQPIDWTAAALRESKRELDKWYPVALQYAGAEAMLSPEFEAALCDDLNTPDAITHLRRLYSEAQAGVAFAGARLHACGALLGLADARDLRTRDVVLEAAGVAVRHDRVAHLDTGVHEGAHGAGRPEVDVVGMGHDGEHPLDPAAVEVRGQVWGRWRRHRSQG